VLDTRPQIGVKNQRRVELLDTSSHTPLTTRNARQEVRGRAGSNARVAKDQSPKLNGLENQLHRDGDVAGDAALHV
jgi:hypothetical protein